MANLYPTGAQALSVSNGATSGSISGIALDLVDVLPGDELSIAGFNVPLLTISAGTGNFTLAASGWTATKTFSTFTVTVASPGVLTWAAHGLTAGTPVLLTTTGALPTGLSIGTVYYVVSPTTNTFSLALTSGGAAINTTGTQSGTHTVARTDWWVRRISDQRYSGLFMAQQSSRGLSRLALALGRGTAWPVKSALNTPPGSPVEGDTYQIGTSPTGAWASNANGIAQYLNGAWVFPPVQTGDMTFNLTTNVVSIWNGTTWGTSLPSQLPVANGGTSGTTIATATAALGINAVNLIINGCFQINQRVYVSAASLSAAAFGHDRWKAGASGCTYTFTQLASTTTVTLTAGTLTQVIESNNIAGGVYTLSWTGTATARIYQGSPTGSYVASPITTASLTADTNTIVEFSTGTLANVQFQAGSVASPFVRRPFGAELLLCQRYFQDVIRGTNQTIFPPFAAKTSGGAFDFGLKLPVPMRVAPTLVTSNPTFSSGAPAGTANAVAFFDPNAGYATISGAFLIVLSSSATDCVLVRLVAGTSFSGTIGANGQIYIGAGYIALSAEL